MTFRSGTMYKVDFKKIFQPNEHEVAYAACWLVSNRDQEKLFGLGTNDGAKVWLNGKVIHVNHRPRIVEIDDDYLRLQLKKGKNLLLLKIDNGGGRWGFALRPVNETIAWQHIQQDIDRELLFDFTVEDDSIMGVVGDKFSVGALKELPQIELIFKSLSSDHQKQITARLGSFLSKPVSDFPDPEYSVQISVPMDSGLYQFKGYLDTLGNVIRQVRKLMYTDLPPLPPSRKMEYYKDIVETMQWMDQANKFFNHSYAYRRYLDGLKKIHSDTIKRLPTLSALRGLFPKPKKVRPTKRMVTVTMDWCIYDPGRCGDFIEAEIARVWKKQFNS